MAKRRAITFETARAIGCTLPGVEEGTTYGTPALKVRGRMFVCVPNHRTAEPDSLAIRLDFHRRDELLAADPDVYYLPGQYVDYPVILVRLSRVDVNALRELIHVAHGLASAPRTRRVARGR